jgi:hypothetical protein
MASRNFTACLMKTIHSFVSFNLRREINMWVKNNVHLRLLEYSGIIYFYCGLIKKKNSKSE